MNAVYVRWSAAQRFGLSSLQTSDRSADGLVELMEDASANFQMPPTHDRLYRWQTALFAGSTIGGLAGIGRIAVGGYCTNNHNMQIVSGQPGQEVLRAALQKAVFWQRANACDLNVRQKKTLARLLAAGNGGFLGSMTTDRHSKVNNKSKPTATRDLTQLHASGLLVAIGVGKGTRYAGNVVGWNQSSECKANGSHGMELPPRMVNVPPNPFI